jgi:hypothetical protein
MRKRASNGSSRSGIMNASSPTFALHHAQLESHSDTLLVAAMAVPTKRTLQARSRSAVSSLRCQSSPLRIRMTSAHTSYPRADSFAPSQTVKTLSSGFACLMKNRAPILASRSFSRFRQIPYHPYSLPGKRNGPSSVDHDPKPTATLQNETTVLRLCNPLAWSTDH